MITPQYSMTGSEVMVLFPILGGAEGHMGLREDGSLENLLALGSHFSFNRFRDIRNICLSVLRPLSLSFDQSV